MLGDLHLLDDLSQRSTITGTVFTSDANFSSAFRLKRRSRISKVIDYVVTKNQDVGM